MRTLTTEELEYVGGALLEGVYGNDPTYCPPGYAIAVEFTKSIQIVAPNASATVGATGPVPSGTATLNVGTTTTTYTEASKCVPDLSSKVFDEQYRNFLASNASLGLDETVLIHAF